MKNFVIDLNEGRPLRMISGEVIRRRTITIWGKTVCIILFGFPVVSSEVFAAEAVLGADI